MTCGPVGGADPETMLQSDLIISWSADLVTTAVHAWAKTEEARARGAQLVVIDPRRSRTAAQADWHIAPRIGTDAALALGLMHVLVRDGLADRSYLARQTVGFDRLEREVLPRFAPGRVAEITGLPVADIERLAHLYGRARAPYIRIGFGMSRSSQGGQAIRAVACLPAVVGAYAKRGGGALVATVGGFGFSFEAVRRPSGPAATRLVNHSLLGQALLEMRDPPIRALFVSANNPAVTCPDSAAVRRGLMREDLFTVVHDPFLTDTARYADLVLPATTYLETEDLFRAYGAYYVQFAPQAVPAQGEAWSNLRLAQELARRLGVRDAVFSMDTRELVRTAFVGATGPAARLDPDALRTAGPIKVDPYPDGQRFGTPSGKLEFYSETLASKGLPPMPDWHEDAEETAQGRRWPLRLLTAPGYFQSHTAFTGNRALRRREGDAGGDPPSDRRGPARAASGGRGRARQRPRHRGHAPPDLRRGQSGRRAGARPAAGGRGAVRHGQPALRGPAHGSRRGRHLPEHLPRRPPGPAGLTGPPDSAPLPRAPPPWVERRVTPMPRSTDLTGPASPRGGRRRDRRAS